MKASEFFEKVEQSLKETKGTDALGAMFFIQDMEELFDKWNEPGDGEAGS